jgi:hypothetical protein
MSCVCTPNREQLINSIMSRVAPTTFQDVVEQVSYDLLHHGTVPMNWSGAGQVSPLPSSGR